MSGTEEYSCIKRIEGQMRSVLKEFKNSQQRLAAFGNDANQSMEQDGKIDRLL